MRYTAYRTKTTTAVLGVLLLFMVSCKSRKAAVQAPPARVETTKTETDAELNSIKKDLPDSQVERTTEGIKFTFSSEILFPTNSSYLNENSSRKLADVVAVILQKANNAQILVEGHSDKTGTPEYNKWLSDKRAVSVKNHMVLLGIDDNKIKTAGLGDTRPIADNKTKEGRLINRRVEITLLKAD